MADTAPTSYVICTSPRSGSTMLCHMLRATRVAGRPGSLFHEPALDSWLAYYGLSGQDYPSRIDALQAVLSEARIKGTAGTGVFGMRLQRHSFTYFMEQLTLLFPDHTSDQSRMTAAFGPTLYIYLNRSDKVAQAISRVIAEQSGLWHRNADGSELERLAPAQELRYDHAAIAAHVEELQNMQSAWENWFAQTGISPLQITYEDLCNAPQAELARVLKALGLDTGLAAQIAPPTARLTNAINRNWADRYRTERAADPSGS